MSNALDQLLAVAFRAGLELSPEDYADSLWLALQIARANSPAISIEPIVPVDEFALADTSPEQLVPAEAIPVEVPLTAPSPPGELPVSASHSEMLTPLSEGRIDILEGKAGIYATSPSEIANELPFYTPESPALPGRLDLARALRPLMIRVISNRYHELDEPATIQRIADADLWVPLLKPGRERWFELALVVDGAPSVLIWRRVITELHELLAHHGAFRDVRLWTLRMNDSVPALQTGLIPSLTTRTHNFDALLDPRGRRIVLIVTDAVAQYWRDGTLYATLRKLAAQTLLTVVQLLPEQLWSRTALARLPAGQITAPRAASTSSNLYFDSAMGRLDDQLEKHPSFNGGLAVPVITLEPEIIFAWANMIVGKSGASTAGVLLPIQLRTSRHPVRGVSHRRSAEERLAVFFATASPMAVKLSRLLSAASPLNLHVMRLIQEALLPNSRQVHLAEIFLSGLLGKMSSTDVFDPESALYDFHPGVRNGLLSGTSTIDMIQVLEVVSVHISKHLGRPVNFRSWLADPQSLLIDDNIRPFALASIEVLRRLGGAYAALASSISERISNRTTNNANKTTPTEKSDLPLDVDDSVAKPSNPELLSRLSLWSIPALVTTPSANNSEINAEPEQWRVLTMVNGKNTVGAIAKKSGLGTDRTRDIFSFLLRNNLVELQASNLNNLLFPEFERVAIMDIGPSVLPVFDRLFSNLGIVGTNEITPGEIPAIIDGLEIALSEITSSEVVSTVISAIKTHANQALKNTTHSTPHSFASSDSQQIKGEDVIISKEDRAQEFNKSTPDNQQFRSGTLVITEKNVSIIRRTITQLMSDLGAQNVLLTDRAGMPLVEVGSAPNLPMMIVLPLLATGFSTTSEVSRQLGDENSTSVFIHEGDNTDLYCFNVMQQFLMVLTFNKKVSASKIGAVWINSRRVIRELREALAD